MTVIVAGSTGNLQYNKSGALAALATTISGSDITFPGEISQPAQPLNYNGGTYKGSAPYIVGRLERDSRGDLTIDNWIPSTQRAAIRNHTTTWDATAALKAAAASGERIDLGNSTFYITDTITPAWGTVFKGAAMSDRAGQGQGTHFKVNWSGIDHETYPDGTHAPNYGRIVPACNHAAPGFFNVNVASHYSDLTVEFDQQSFSGMGLGDIYQYPAAFVTGTPCENSILDNILINRAWVGFDMRAVGTSCNDTTWRRLKIGAYGCGIYFDRQFNFCHGDDFEFYSWGMDANQAVPYYANGGCKAMDIGFSAMTLSNIASFYAYIYCHTTPDGFPDVSIDGLALDTAHIQVSGGQVVVGSMWGTRDQSPNYAAGRDNRYFFTDNTGQLSIGAVDVEAAQMDTSPIGGCYGGLLNIGSGVLRQFGTSAPAIEVSGGYCSLGSGLVLAGHPSFPARTSPLISQHGTGAVQVDCAVERTSVTGNPVAYFATDVAGNYINPNKYKGMNGGTPVGVGFAIGSNNVGYYGV